MMLLTGSRITQSFLLTVKTREPQCLCLLQSEQRKRMSTNHAAIDKRKPPPSRSAPAIIDMQSTTEEPPLGESELFLRTRDEVSSGTMIQDTATSNDTDLSKGFEYSRHEVLRWSWPQRTYRERPTDQENESLSSHSWRIRVSIHGLFLAYLLIHHISTALAKNPKSFVFGEDVETGVFRCTTGLVDEFGGSSCQSQLQHIS